MRDKKLFKTGLSVLAISMAAAYAPASSAALTYSADFESPLLGDMVGNTDIYNYKIGNIVNGGGGWFPGTVGAPANYNTGYSAIVAGEGDVAQGGQQLSIFNDYNPWSPFTMGAGTTIQTFVSNDIGLITSDMVGNTYSFTFDGKLGNIVESPTGGEPVSQAEAFVKVLKSSDLSYIELANNVFDSDANLTTAWGGGSIDLLVDAGMVGETLQIGFNSTATDYSPSGVFYDNLNFDVAAVPVPAAIWLFGSGIVGLVGVARRRKS